jgi:hypothetical protein
MLLPSTKYELGKASKHFIKIVLADAGGPAKAI